MEHFIRLIEKHLECNDKKKLANNLCFIQKTLILLLEQVANSDSYEEAELVFKVLEDIQFVLAKAIFKKGILVSPPH